MKKTAQQALDEAILQRVDELFALAKHSAELEEMTDEELRASLAKEEPITAEEYAKHVARMRKWLAERG